MTKIDVVPAGFANKAQHDAYSRAYASLRTATVNWARRAAAYVGGVGSHEALCRALAEKEAAKRIYRLHEQAHHARLRADWSATDAKRAASRAACLTAALAA